MKIHSPARDLQLSPAENLTSPLGNRFTKPINEFNNNVKV